MNARPGRSVARSRTIIVAAGVIDVPVEIWRCEAFLRHPIPHRHPVERRRPRAALHRNCELTRGAALQHEILKPAILLAIPRRGCDLRLDPLLPAIASTARDREEY